MGCSYIKFLLNSKDSDNIAAIEEETVIKSHSNLIISVIILFNKSNLFIAFVFSSFVQYLSDNELILCIFSLFIFSISIWIFSTRNKPSVERLIILASPSC